jgi:hypothetical protein
VTIVQKRKHSRRGKPAYKPTEREHVVSRKFLDEAVKAPPSVTVSANGEVTPNHPINAIGLALLLDAVGSSDMRFLDVFLNQLASASAHGSKFDNRTVNFMLSVVTGIKPRDQVEAMLASQMAAVHMATMRSARDLTHAEYLSQQATEERTFNKLARTFAFQMEALKRYRTGGEQKVTVQHVTVGEGGQAIVGNVTHGSRERRTKKLPSHHCYSRRIRPLQCRASKISRRGRQFRRHACRRNDERSSTQYDLNAFKPTLWR